MFGSWDDSGGALGAIPAYLGPPVRQGKPSGGNVVMWPGTTLPDDSQRGQSLKVCLEYVAKYRRLTGRDPVGVWCVGQTLPPRPSPVIPPFQEPGPPVFVPESDVAPRPTLKPAPAPYRPPIRVQPPPPPVSPVYSHWGWRRRRPPVTRPFVPKAAPVPVVAVTPVEICPIRGYTSRAIAGANEYQNFRCTPGQPVSINAGLQAAGRQDALARGLSGLDGLTVGNIEIPSWLPLVGIGVLAVMFLGKGRRR